MSLMIKGMSMPKSCEECPCREYPEFSFESDWCCLNKKTISDVKVISPNCPFIEIPTPHGRLIDADELIERIERFRDIHNYYPADIDATMRWFINQICGAKTIIEAEVGV